MYRCEFCGFEIPDRASFCGNCGQLPRELATASTGASGYSSANIDEIDTAKLRAMQDVAPVVHGTVNRDEADTATTVSVPGNERIFWDFDSVEPDAVLPDSRISPLYDNEDEEERRRRALDLGLPLFDGVAGQFSVGNVPIAEGTPQVGGVPFVQNAPQVMDMPLNAALQAPVAPQMAGVPQAPNPTTPVHFPSPGHHLPHHPHKAHSPHHPHHPHPSQRPARGCAPIWLLAALLVPIIIVMSLIGVGFALWKSSSSPNGHNNVVQNSTMPTTTSTDATSPSTAPTATPTVTTSPTGSSSAAATPTPVTSPTATPAPSPTATTTSTGLSCISPTAVNLGPVSEGYNGFTSQPVQLCTTGSGTVNWTASWDQAHAPWLTLDSNTGQISAPGQGQVGVNAYTSKLTPGNYSAPVTFTSQPGNKTFTLNVSFTVQAGCISGTPRSLSFIGIAGQSDPQPQTVTITNCGAIGTWSESTKTDTGANWLSANPTGNNLNAGAPSGVTITASNLIAKLRPGTYSGKVIFSIGSGSFILYVTLTVQSPIG